VTIFMAGKLGAAGGRVNGHPPPLFRFAGRGIDGRRVGRIAAVAKP
jgi:hypothetical protein